jgi:hypothetical protein
MLEAAVVRFTKARGVATDALHVRALAILAAVALLTLVFEASEVPGRSVRSASGRVRSDAAPVCDVFE